LPDSEILEVIKADLLKTPSRRGENQEFFSLHMKAGRLPEYVEMLVLKEI
jgi:hypothetical protein